MRPTYSAAGFKRRLQMSRIRLHLVVEGKMIDPNFYGRLLLSSDSLSQNSETIPVEMVSGTGGKPAILDLFDWCRKNSALRLAKSGGESVVVFALDRDSDFLTGGTRRSPHVLYTRHYDVESELFAHGDLESAIGAALSLTPVEADAVVSGMGNLHENLANRWRTWILLCCIAKAHGASCEVTFSRKVSLANQPPYGPDDPSSVMRLRETLRSAVGVSATEFAVIEAKISTRLDSYYRRGNEGTLVRGKWLPAFLEEAIIPHLPSRKLPKKSVGQAISAHLLVTLDFSQPWARYYLDKLESV